MLQQIFKANAWVLLKRHKKCLQAYRLNLVCKPSTRLGGWSSHISTEQEKKLLLKEFRGFGLIPYFEQLPGGVFPLTA